jgi:hypothetical protein
MIFSNFVFRVAAVCLFCGLALGCGGTDGQLPVTGEVTLDGQPLKSGSIQFEPVNNSATTASGTVIENGKYSLSEENGLDAGEYRVAISSAGTTSAPSMDGGGVAEELIPALYNEKSSLAATVKETGENHFVFKLLSEPPQE